MEQETIKKIAKHTAKDSVFTDMFGRLPFLLQMYQSLHPEDDTTEETDLKILTIQNILVNQMYNDLGFLVKGRLIILVECQSIWAINIVLRLFLYLAQTYKDYISDNRLNVHSSTKLTLPKPELYMIYTGDPFKDMPEELSLADEFFGGDRSVIDVKAKVIYDGRKGDIINQYCTFTKIYKEQVKLHGWTRKAAWETIRVCMEQDVLREYLKDREKEVIDIMSTLFDQESAMKAWEYEITREANLRIAQAQVQVVQAQKQAAQSQKQAAQSQKQVVQLQKKEILNAYNLYKEGFPIESISNAFGISVQTLQKSFADYRKTSIDKNKGN